MLFSSCLLLPHFSQKGYDAYQQQIPASEVGHWIEGTSKRLGRVKPMLNKQAESEVAAWGHLEHCPFHQAQADHGLVGMCM